MADNARPPQGTAPRAPGSFLQGVMREGTDADERIEGTLEEDILQGGGGDDVIVSHGAADFIDGGAGRDVAVLPGKRGDYSFAMQGKRLLARRGALAVRLIRVEAMAFEAEPGKQYRLDLPE
ncbi:hypothetical protein U5922_003500 [Aquicoccus sp. G2-2]|uniref:hypothetical protein n=1 Tax=Aquicoccus sp. G2-2 TaxID=3092120 RepID=UPI002AE06233|nr:hypothetical protein [Aquicoccus sp. G2-2]MEA1112579.1 hypothetical protein [Aquicoccus sp. G2-2]